MNGTSLCGCLLLILFVIVATVEFPVRPFEGRDDIRQVMPVVDGVPLDEMIASFEEDLDFDVIGGYGGLVVEYFNFGDLRDYFLGANEHRYFSRLGKIAVLACGDCGEVGCWPLHAAVTADDESVTWSLFEQPHRAGRDYTWFGPFVFERDQYEAAVGALARPDHSV